MARNKSDFEAKIIRYLKDYYLRVIHEFIVLK